MKNFFFIFLLCCFASGLSGQNRANIWMFGEHGHKLDFNTHPPVFHYQTAWLSDCSTGCVVVSDRNGKPMVYTNGIRVWNGKDSIVAGGDSIIGFRGTSGHTIFPYPGSDSLLVIITSTYPGPTTTVPIPIQGWYYHIVDVSANEGRGAMVSINNRFVNGLTSAHLKAVPHANKRDVWVLVSRFEYEEILAFSFTDTGMAQQPVATLFGPLDYLNEGTISLSDDNRIAISFKERSIVLGYFNDSTGVIENFNRIDCTAWNSHVMATTLDPTGKFFYINSHYLPQPRINWLLQFEVKDSLGLMWLQNPDTLFQSNHYPSWMFIGPDQNLYIGFYFYARLARVVNPSVKCPACLFEPDILNGQIMYEWAASLPNHYLGFLRPCYEEQTKDTALELYARIWLAGGWYMAPATVIDTTYTHSTGCNTITEWRLTLLNDVTNTTAPESGISVYPNPAQGILYVKHTNQNAAFRLYNKLGQVVLEQQNLPPGTAAVSLSGLAEGVYFWEYVLVGTRERVFGKTVKLMDN